MPSSSRLLPASWRPDDVRGRRGGWGRRRGLLRDEGGALPSSNGPSVHPCPLHTKQPRGKRTPLLGRQHVSFDVSLHQKHQEATSWCPKPSATIFSMMASQAEGSTGPSQSALERRIKKLGAQNERNRKRGNMKHETCRTEGLKRQIPAQAARKRGGPALKSGFAEKSPARCCLC